MFEPRVLFLDLETTGASADRDRITEIGLVEVVDGELVEEWSTLINPDRALPPAITSLTGITNHMVADAPPFADIAERLLERLHGALLVAHNARFDYAFLRAEFRRLGVRFRTRTLCTVRLSRRLFPEHRHHNLDSIMQRFELTCSARHRALGDAQVLWGFARELRRTVEPERLAEAVAAITQSTTLPHGLQPERFEDLPHAPGTYTFFAQDGTPLYVGKAGNLRSRVFEHFSADGELDRAQRMALQTASFEWTETAGELGAALREIALLRELTPLFNRRRVGSEIWSLQWTPGGKVEVSPLQPDDDYSPSQAYGLYRSRSDALAALSGVVRAQQLCRILVGLEFGPGPCSAQSSGACRGACVGGETSVQHMLRLAQALARLRITPWPYAGRIGVREADPYRACSEVHVLDRWCYLGSARTEPELAALIDQRTLPPFDLDHYRLLHRHLVKPQQPLPVFELSGRTPLASIW